MTPTTSRSDESYRRIKGLLHHLTAAQLHELGAVVSEEKRARRLDPANVRVTHTWPPEPPPARPAPEPAGPVAEKVAGRRPSGHN